AGSHSYDETAGTNTSLSDYTISSQICKDAQGNTVTQSPTGTLTINDGDAITCTITNHRKTGTLTIKKHIDSALANESGKFNLQIDGVTDLLAMNVGDGGSTSTQTLPAGNHSYGETAGTNTSLNDYNVTSACVDAQNNAVSHTN